MCSSVDSIQPNQAENNEKAQKPSKEKSKGILSQTKEYADAASIHGIKYIAEDGRHPIERKWEG